MVDLMKINLNRIPKEIDIINKRGRTKVYRVDKNWQKPAQTELRCAERVISSTKWPRGISYVALPWAHIFDQINIGNSENLRPYISLMEAISEISKNEILLTCCQHIHYYRYIALFNIAKINHAFCSHKSKGLNSACGIQLHPFPLYPVQFDNEYVIYGEERETLFSFVGANSDKWYISDVRRMINECLADNPHGKIIVTDSWFYHEHVFGSKDTEFPASVIDENYRNTLLSSKFCLCPSGTGPNTIRLWEAIGAGCIPVIISDRWDPPGGFELWSDAGVFVAETREAIESLPALLAEISFDQSRMDAMRAQGRLIWELYGPHNFIHDMNLLVRDGVTRA